MVPHLLLIEGDTQMREAVERGLGSRGFIVSCAQDGAAGIGLLGKLKIDLVLLDLILPDMDGLRVLEDVRALEPRMPVIMLTALDDSRSTVGSLDAGADDYVTKPVSLDELAARVRARLRRREDDGGVLKAGPLTVDLATHRALLGTRDVSLSGRELTLLAVFMRHPGQVLSRGQLLEMVWAPGFDPGSNVVDVYVAALRRKIDPGFIETVRGTGYRFVVTGNAAEGRAAP